MAVFWCYRRESILRYWIIKGVSEWDVAAMLGQTYNLA